MRVRPVRYAPTMAREYLTDDEIEALLTQHQTEGTAGLRQANAGWFPRPGSFPRSELPPKSLDSLGVNSAELTPEFKAEVERFINDDYEPTWTVDELRQALDRFRKR